MSAIIRGVWHSLRFSVSQLEKNARDWDCSVPIPLEDGINPTESFTVNFGLSSIIDFRKNRLIQSCNLSQWWQKFEGVPKCASRLLMYGSDSLRSDLIAVQVYTSDDGVLLSRPFVFKITQPVMVKDGSRPIPLLGASFNHLAWVQEVSHLEGDERGRKRILHLVPYPELDLSGIRDSTPPLADHRKDMDVHKFVDVPDDVLCDALQIFPEPALGGVIITTTSLEFYRFPFV